jgi:RNA polymerase sigma-70 factor (ECF subfamily)
VDSKSEREAKFGQLLETHASALRRLCSAYRRDREAQEDLFQEIAVALWTALQRFRGDASERTWLYRIAHNVALTDSARWQRRRSREIPFEQDPPVISLEGGPREDLLDAVRRLEPIERELALPYLEGGAKARKDLETVRQRIEGGKDFIYCQGCDEKVRLWTSSNGGLRAIRWRAGFWRWTRPRGSSIRRRWSKSSSGT